MNAVNKPAETALTEVPVGLIQDVVARHFGFRRGDLLAHRREPDLARHVAVYLAKRLTVLSMVALAAHFGRDRTTLAHSVEVVTAKAGAEPAFAAEIETLVMACIGAASAPEALPRSVDPVASAERVARGGARAAIALPALDTVAVCVRAVALEEAAGLAFQLLANADLLHAAALASEASGQRGNDAAALASEASGQRGNDAAAGSADEPVLIARHQALVAALVGTLEGLGYEIGEDSAAAPSSEGAVGPEVRGAAVKETESTNDEA